MHNVLLRKIHGIGKPTFFQIKCLLKKNVPCLSVSPACMCANTCICVRKGKDVRADDLPNGWSDLHVFRMLLHCHFLNSSYPLCSSLSLPFSDSKLNIFSFFFFLSCLTQSTQIPLFPLSPLAIAPDFSQNLLKAQTLARQGGDILIECKPRMSPRGVISWRKGKEALRESHRYQVSLYRAANSLCVGPQLFSLSAE